MYTVSYDFRSGNGACARDGREGKKGREGKEHISVEFSDGKP